MKVSDDYRLGLMRAAAILHERRTVALGLLGPVPMPFSMDETYTDAIRAITTEADRELLREKE